MYNDIIKIGKNGSFEIDQTNPYVINLYLTVYNRSEIDLKKYEELLKQIEDLFGKIQKRYMVAVLGEALLFAWGIYELADFKDLYFSEYFDSFNKIMQSYEGYTRVVKYLISHARIIHTKSAFHIKQEEMSVSDYKTVQQIDNLSELISKNEEVIKQLVKTARDTAIEMDERLDDAKKRLAEKDSELQKVCKENELLRSDTYRKEMGEEYLRKMFKGYLKNARRWSQHRRDTEYEWLQHLLRLEGMSQDVKEMIESLAEDKEEERVGVTVKAEAGATVNNYDIHGNNQVNTNKED